MRTTVASFLFTLLLPLLGFANPHGSSMARSQRRHSDLSRSVEPRSYRATFYEVGLGACGGTNSDSDFIVAMNVQQFAGGSVCYKMITINYQGKSTQAQVVDECMGCPYGGIDMSPSLFSFFADQSAGEIQVDWNFGGGDPAPAPAPSPKPKPKPSTTSSTWTPTSTSETSETSTSTSYSSSSSTSSSSSSSPSSSSYSTSTTPTSTETPTATPTPSYAGPDNLRDLQSLVAGLGQLVLSAGQ